MAMFGGMFGINGDGKLSCMDKVVGYGFSGRSRKRRRAGAEYFASQSYSSPVCYAPDEDIVAEVSRAVKLILAGLSEDALRDMDDYQRWEALEDAGLDPLEYDYLDN
jgi:hypothetical protein